MVYAMYKYVNKYLSIYLSTKICQRFKGRAYDVS